MRTLIILILLNVCRPGLSQDSSMIHEIENTIIEYLDSFEDNKKIFVLNTLFDSTSMSGNDFESVSKISISARDLHLPKNEVEIASLTDLFRNEVMYPMIIHRSKNGDKYFLTKNSVVVWVYNRSKGKGSY